MGQGSTHYLDPDPDASPCQGTQTLTVTCPIERASTGTPATCHRVAEDPACGRYLVATQDCPAGTTVLRELEPFACVVEDSAAEFTCHHCLSPLGKSPIVCSGCGFTRFCSAECEELASGHAHHPLLCGALQRLGMVQMQYAAATEGDTAAREVWDDHLLKDTGALRLVMVLLAVWWGSEQDGGGGITDAASRGEAARGMVANKVHT